MDTIKNKIKTINTRNASIRDIESYKDAGIEKYIYMAALDNRTCPICGDLDGKIINVSDAKEGVNLPPMHEGCRCTTRAYINGMMRGQRRARNPITNKSELIDYMDYNEWIKTVNTNDGK